MWLDTMESGGSVIRLLMVVLCWEGVWAVKMIHHIQTPMNWTEAQRYCRANLFDLVSLSSLHELNSFLGLGFFDVESFLSVDGKSWTGLFRESSNQEWVWSDTGDELNYADGNLNELYDGKSTDENCAAVGKNGKFHTHKCDMLYPFFCYQTIWHRKLVNIQKTWGEALEYCRTYYNDMASLLSSEQLQNAQGQIPENGSAWIGLRYVVRHWLWMNGDALENQAWAGSRQPQCPGKGEHCGALSAREQGWVNIDCEQTLPFFCRF